MAKPSGIYELVEQIHDSFLGRTGFYTPEEISGTGINLAFGPAFPNVTEKLHANGVIDGRPAYQSLAKDKFGNFHLSTVFTEWCGEHVQHDFRTTSGLEDLDVIANSLFIRALEGIVASRLAIKEATRIS